MKTDGPSEWPMKVGRREKMLGSRYGTEKMRTRVDDRSTQDNNGAASPNHAQASLKQQPAVRALRPGGRREERRPSPVVMGVVVVCTWIARFKSWTTTRFKETGVEHMQGGRLKVVQVQVK
jgi:hypothetical protein